MRISSENPIQLALRDLAVKYEVILTALRDSKSGDPTIVDLL